MASLADIDSRYVIIKHINATLEEEENQKSHKQVPQGVTF